MPHAKFIVRCRGIIFHENKLLVVRHTGNTTFHALPGGHLEFGEDIQSCIAREIKEELGIEPKIGRLLYTNTFISEKDTQTVEFIFEITNAREYVGCEKLARTHAYELAELVWVSSKDDVRILPEKIGQDLKTGNLLSNSTRYINGLIK